MSGSAFVRFRVPGQGEHFATRQLVVTRDVRVIVDTDYGLRMGTVVSVEPNDPRAAELRPLLRVATADDERIAAQQTVREREAFDYCEQCIGAHQLPMKLVSVELAHSGTRAVFNFASEERVDFRALVKDLARRFHTRIEMRQIGVRDAARHLGGLGMCGRELCCSAWLPEFQPISIRMAKDQNLSLNHDKLSGLCGRLRCCLQYEEETYHAERKSLPKIGKRVATPLGEGRVKDVNVLERRVRVQLMDGSYAEFAGDEVTRPADVVEQQDHQRAVEEQRAQAAATGEPMPKKKRRRRRKKKGGGGTTAGDEGST